jgi:hypothetical protein
MSISVCPIPLEACFGTEDWHAYHIRQKVKMGSIVQEIVGNMNDQIKFSETGPEDLVFPR